MRHRSGPSPLTPGSPRLRRGSKLEDVARASRVGTQVRCSDQSRLSITIVNCYQKGSHRSLRTQVQSTLGNYCKPFTVTTIRTPRSSVQQRTVQSVRRLAARVLRVGRQFLPRLRTLSALIVPAAATLPIIEPRLRCSLSTGDSVTSAPARLVGALPSPKPISRPLQRFLNSSTTVVTKLGPFVGSLA